MTVRIPFVHSLYTEQVHICAYTTIRFLLFVFALYLEESPINAPTENIGSHVGTGALFSAYFQEMMRAVQNESLIKI